MDDVSRLRQKAQKLMEERLRIPGSSLARQLRKAGRLIPRARRRDGTTLAQTETLAGHPKLSRMVSGPETVQAGERFIQWLETVDPKERRKTAWLHRLAGIAFNLLIILVIFLVVLRWRGFL